MWSTAGNWTNGAPTGATNVFIDNGNANGQGASAVTLDISGATANLTVDSDDSLSLNPSTSLTIAGSTISNAGSVNLNSTGARADLIINGPTSGSTVTLSGGGTVTLSNNSNNRIYSSQGSTLVNMETIQGAGQIGAGGSLVLNNKGLIDANLSTPLIIVTSAAVTNTGTLEASASGTLDLGGTFNNAKGTILATGLGSLVQVNGTFNAGTLTTTGGGVIQTAGGAALNGVAISTGSTFTAPNNTSTTLLGTITNKGTLDLSSTGNQTDLVISGTVTQTGGGSITMSNNVNNRIRGVTSSDTLINDTKTTIQGAGQIGPFGTLTLTNKGIIDANVSNSLTISTGATNTGTLEATNGGTLLLQGYYTNTGGTILATGPGSTVNVNAEIIGGTLTTTSVGTIESTSLAILNGVTISKGSTFTTSAATSLQGAITNQGTLLATGAGSVVTLFNGTTINGGTLTTAGGGTIQTQSGPGPETLNGVTISAGSTFTSNSTINLLGKITDSGTLAVNSGNLMIGNTVDLTGGGSIILNGQSILGTASSDILVNDVKTTIQGNGQIVAGSPMILDNKGLIDANHSNPLGIGGPASITNSGTLEASSGGTLDLGGTFNNTGGTVLAIGAGSVVNMIGTINGGTLATTVGGTIQSLGTLTLNGAKISSGSTVTLTNNTTTTLMGSTFTNNGTLTLNSTGNFTNLVISGTVTHTGGGSITMSNNMSNRIYGTATSDTLINDTKNTIQGAGQIGGFGGPLVLNNKGVLDANVSNALTVANFSSSPDTNTGTMEATNGGTLLLGGGFANTGGTILAAGPGSVVELGAAINGGTLTTTLGGAIETPGGLGPSTLNGVTISSGSTFTGADNSVTQLEGTITNKGVLALNSAGNNTDLVISGSVLHTGGGTVTMSNNATNRIYANSSGNTLTNAAGATIQGAGQIGVNNNLTVINNGLIDANRSVPLAIYAVHSMTNTGMLEASQGGTLNLSAPVNNTGGKILATGFGSVVSLNGSGINGGTLTTTGGGTIENTGSAGLIGVTISGGSTFTAADNSSTDLINSLTNDGTLSMQSAGNPTDLVLENNVTLSGGGTVTMSNNGNNRIYSLSGSSTLTNQDNLIEGSGQIGVGQMGLINNGTILANLSNSLIIQPNGLGFTNNGTLKVASGSLMHVQGGPFTNFSGSTLTGGTYDVLGTLQIDQLGSSSGGEIATNQANIILDGPTSIITDSTGFGDALSPSFKINAATGSFTIQNGRDFTTPGDFQNAGSLMVGNASAFKTGPRGTNTYTQTGGSTKVFGTLAAGTAAIQGGTLSGSGVIDANVNNSGGTVTASDPGSPTILTINGTYTQGSGGTLEAFLKGIAAGSKGYSQLQVSSTVTLDGTLDVDLVAGSTFSPDSGDTFFLLTSGGDSGAFANLDFSDAPALPAGDTWHVIYNANNVELQVQGPVAPVSAPAATPEPSTWVMMGTALAMMIGFGWMNHRRASANVRT